jgi:hypothetical protein
MSSETTGLLRGAVALVGLIMLTEAHPLDYVGGALISATLISRWVEDWRKD